MNDFGTSAQRLKLVSAALALSAASLACSDAGTVSPFLTDVVGADSLAGDWVLRLPATSGCKPDLPAFELELRLERAWVAGVDNEGPREYLTGSWIVIAGDTVRKSLQGWIEPETRSLHLLLWQGVHVRGSVLTARVIGGRVIDGRLDEPIPPYPGGGYAQPFEGYPGGFTNARCEWDVRGERLPD